METIARPFSETHHETENDDIVCDPRIWRFTIFLKMLVIQHFAMKTRVTSFTNLSSDSQRISKHWPLEV